VARVWVLHRWFRLESAARDRCRPAQETLFFDTGVTHA